MQFVYHPHLIEQVVFLVTRSDPARECELHERIDPFYAIGEPETRSAAFAGAYAELFSQWKLADSFEECLLSLVGNLEIKRCAMAPAGRSRHQKVDLLSRSDEENTERTVFLLIKPEAVLDPTPLLPWIRREFLFVADMLNDRFGYRPDDIIGTAWERKLSQDRYLVLWRIYVASRLHRTGHQDEAELRSCRTSFQKAFRHRGADPTTTAFDRVFGAEAMTHQQLLGWATEPAMLLDNTACPGANGPNPGGLCPLCGFPTHDWFDFESPCIHDCLTAIKAAHPKWSGELGACRQCVETYMHRVVGNKPPKNRLEGECDVRTRQKEPVCS